MHKLCVNRVGPHTYRVQNGEHAYMLERHYSDAFTGRVEAAGKRHRVLTSLQGTTRIVTIDGTSHRVSRDSGGLVRSPAAAIVLAVIAKPGDRVEMGSRLLTLEAMKMEAAVHAPVAGVVKEILVSPNQQVSPGTPLLVLETGAGNAEATQGSTLHITLPAEPVRLNFYKGFLDELEALLLGYDGDVKRICTFAIEHPVPMADTLGHGATEQRVVTLLADLFAIHAHADDIETGHPSGEPFRYYLRTFDIKPLSPTFVKCLERHMKRYGATDLTRSRKLEEALLLTHRAHTRVSEVLPAIIHLLENCLERDGQNSEGVASKPSDTFSRELLDGLVIATQNTNPAINNLARSLRHRAFEHALTAEMKTKIYSDLARRMDSVVERNPGYEDVVRDIAECPFPLVAFLLERLLEDRGGALALEVLLHHYYRERQFELKEHLSLGGCATVAASFGLREKAVRVLVAAVRVESLAKFASEFHSFMGQFSINDEVMLDIFVPDAAQSDLRTLANLAIPKGESPLARLSILALRSKGSTDAITLRKGDQKNAWQEDILMRGLHPVEAKRFELWRMSEFQITRQPTRSEDIHLFRLVSNANSRDERVFVYAEVRDLTPVRNDLGRMVEIPHFERMFREAATCLREALLRYPTKREPSWNRIILNIAPPLIGQEREFLLLAHKLQPYVANLHLEKVVIKAQVLDRAKGGIRDQVIELSNANESGLKVAFLPPRSGPLTSLSEYERRVIQMRMRRQVYAYEIIRMLTPARTGEQSEFPAGEFEEWDYTPQSPAKLTPINREYGKNSANVVVGLIRNFTPRHPEGMERVLVIGDGARDMGALAEAECRRIMGAIDLAAQRKVPVEWFPVSSGARISMDSGTENLDWTARVLRHIIEFTEAGGEINIVVNGINVGAQAYWNAEATMLMHTRGILIMTPEGSMVLTGKRALDYSGGVSAEDNQGIGGFERVMGPNGQAQYYARDFREACRILFSHYEFTYLVPGEAFVRRARTSDPIVRDPGAHLHPEAPFATVGEIFSDVTNPGRKKPFDMRSVLAAVVDNDLPTLERWKSMRHADTAIVWDAYLAGIPACVIGVESKPLPRSGYVPGDGPDSWAGGTLFPHSSKKVARAINSASGNRPVVVLANLSGFDGSPESLRNLQLEYGAEIGRAVVKCKSPIVFCVITRFHGGAYVVFSTALNDKLEVAALEGSYASVIGGTPAAAVVFPNEVRDRAHADPRIKEIQQQLQSASERQKPELYAALNTLFQKVYLEKQSEVATEFDGIHSVDRALKVGSLHKVVKPRELRAYLVNALERGMTRQEISGGNGAGVL